jgi:hypothetical protein
MSFSPRRAFTHFRQISNKLVPYTVDASRDRAQCHVNQGDQNVSEVYILLRSSLGRLRKLADMSVVVSC